MSHRQKSRGPGLAHAVRGLPRLHLFLLCTCLLAVALGAGLHSEEAPAAADTWTVAEATENSASRGGDMLLSELPEGSPVNDASEALLTTLVGTTDSTAAAPQGAATAPPSMTEPAAPSDGEPAPPANEKSHDRPAATDAKYHCATMTVRRGDSLSAMLARVGVAAGQLQEVLALGKLTKPLHSLTPGQELVICHDDAGALQSLDFPLTASDVLQVTRHKGKLKASVVHRELQSRLSSASAEITSSLFASGQSAGLSGTQIVELASIFAWDIDFAQDLREGDRFAVLYEEKLLDGERVAEGHIVAAEFINQGQLHQAIRYTDKNGHTDYYTPEGLSMRKAFLRTPVRYSRISSGFSLHRWHPVLHRFRAHKGVDYAAPTGTPVSATGRGKVVFLGRKGGYGNVVAIRHGKHYSTLYGHLSGFAPKLHNGSHVEQGDLIGYVGSTGLATGPHLHYEFRVDGVHRDPLTVALPNAEPIPAGLRADFLALSRRLVAQLELTQDSGLALHADDE